MGPNPLLPSEVREIASQLCFPLNAWLCELIYRLDDAVLKAGREETSKTSDKPHTEIPVSDVQSIREMVKARAATVRLTNEAKAQAKALRVSPNPKPRS